MEDLEFPVTIWELLLWISNETKTVDVVGTSILGELLTVGVMSKKGLSFEISGTICKDPWLNLKSFC